MALLSRRSALRNLALIPASFCVNPRLLNAFVGDSCTESLTEALILPTSICVFIDGSWLLKATGDGIMAVTMRMQNDNLHKYTAGIWRGADSLSLLDPGKYGVTVNGAYGVCDPLTLLKGHSQSMPYLSGVKCIFEMSTPGGMMPTKDEYFLAHLPVPDRIHPAAAIEFGSTDYMGADAGGEFTAPKRSATVMIFEYRHARSIVITKNKDGSSTTVRKGEHYHFSQTLQNSSLCVAEEIQHIRMFTKELSKLLVHTSGTNTTPVDFMLNPTDMAAKHLNIKAGVYDVHRVELGMKPFFSKKPPVIDCGDEVLFTLDRSKKHPLSTHYARLVNCAAGHIAASG